MSRSDVHIFVAHCAKCGRELRVPQRDIRWEFTDDYDIPAYTCPQCGVTVTGFVLEPIKENEHEV